MIQPPPGPHAPEPLKNRQGLIVVGVIGVALLLAGLGFGFTSTSSSGGADCGSPFRSNVAALRLSSDLGRAGDLYAGGGDPGADSSYAECQSEQNVTRPLAIVLIVVGLASGLGTLRAAGM